MAALRSFAALGLTIAMGLAVSAAAEEPSGPEFGGPNAVENQVESDFGESWASWKQRLKDELGLALSVDYTSVVLTANETFDSKDGTGGHSAGLRYLRPVRRRERHAGL
ncbi:MAG: hypothetical protein AAFN78_08585 [Pseudomonadota bacterium]